MTNHCPRCSGFRYLDRTDTPAQWACIACGRRTDVEPFKPLPFVQQHPTPGGGMPRSRTAEVVV